MLMHGEIGEWILMDKRIVIVEIGSERAERMTEEARRALTEAEVILGDARYAKLLREQFAGKEIHTTPRRQEKERCRRCFEEAEKGRSVALVCSADAGIYGLISEMYTLGADYPKTELCLIPGVGAAASDAALLGMPLGDDFCEISLDDRLTPWKRVQRRIVAALYGNFVIVFHNPTGDRRRHYMKRVCAVVMRLAEDERICGYVKNNEKGEARAVICTLRELSEVSDDAFTTAFIGNYGTGVYGGKLLTKREKQLPEKVYADRQVRIRGMSFD